MSSGKFRLITRSDFDGLVCAVLLKELDMIDEVKFVHPKDMQDKKIKISSNDITTNLPFVPGVHLAFDHHSSEELRNEKGFAKNVIFSDAPSTARLVYNHFGGAASFPKVPWELMVAVDKADSADYSYEDVVRPKGWAMLNFLMDPRTGLGRFREFRISNYDLMMELIAQIRADPSVDGILTHPDVAERIALYEEQAPLFRAQLRRLGEVHDKLIVLDLRGEEMIHAGNRFLVYALYPECSLSMHIMWGFQKQNTVFAVGKSILDRSATVDVGERMLAYGGGGHEAAGTCQADNSRAEMTRADLIRTLRSGG